MPMAWCSSCAVVNGDCLTSPPRVTLQAKMTPPTTKEIFDDRLMNARENWQTSGDLWSLRFPARPLLNLQHALFRGFGREMLLRPCRSFSKADQSQTARAGLSLANDVWRSLYRSVSAPPVGMLARPQSSGPGRPQSRPSGGPPEPISGVAYMAIGRVTAPLPLPALDLTTTIVVSHLETSSQASIAPRRLFKSLVLIAEVVSHKLDRTFLDHVLIYGLALFVARACVCVRCACVCVLVQCNFCI